MIFEQFYHDEVELVDRLYETAQTINVDESPQLKALN